MWDLSLRSSVSVDNYLPSLTLLKKSFPGQQNQVLLVKEITENTEEKEKEGKKIDYYPGKMMTVHGKD